MKQQPTVISSVKKWLEGSGFPLEMQTAAAFRKEGFEVRPSSQYIDAETGKGREIDVLTSLRDPDFLGIIEIYFAIECKSSPKPWVLLTSEDAASGYNRIFAFGVLSKKAKHAFVSRIHEFVETLPWFRKEGAIGYSFRQAFSKESDPAYSAALSAAKACEHLARPTDRRHVAPLMLAFPVIVVDAPLIQCSLREDGHLDLQEVDLGEFLFFAHLPHLFGTCIRVVRASRLASFAMEAKRNAEQFRTALKPEEEKIKESWAKH